MCPTDNGITHTILGNRLFFDELTLCQTSITTMIGSFFHIDVLYLINYVVPQIAAQNVHGTIVALLTQGIYGATMLIAPTSAILVLGLSYLGVTYKEWIKRTWLFTLIQVAVVLAVVIASMLIL